MKILKTCLLPALVGLAALHGSDAIAEQVTFQPNNHGKSLTTPIAWGASNNVIFFGVSGTSPSPYAAKSDGAAVVGYGFGDPKEYFGCHVTLISLDISQWKEYAAGVHLFRELGNSSALGVGVENVMLTNGGDSGKSYYAVYSQGVQSDIFVDKAHGTSKLSFSTGVGSGHYGNKSPLDIASGKGDHGTYVFGNIAYDVANEFNLITDWNGLNLNAGVSKTFRFASFPLVATVGAADLTHNSGDGVRFIFAVGTGFKL